MATCRSCHAEIVWAMTEAGRRIPIDAEPQTDGTIRLVDRSYEGRMERFAQIAGKSTTEVRYVTHYATCPDAADWRKRK